MDRAECKGRADRSALGAENRKVWFYAQTDNDELVYLAPGTPFEIEEEEGRRLIKRQGGQEVPAP